MTPPGEGEGTVRSPRDRIRGPIPVPCTGINTARQVGTQNPSPSRCRLGVPLSLLRRGDDTSRLARRCSGKATRGREDRRGPLEGRLHGEGKIAGWAATQRKVNFGLGASSLSVTEGFVAMGLFRGSFTFMLGMGCGVYVAQNYNVPNVKKLFNTYVFLAKHIEETYRKPKKDEDE
ncbi:hypothetical protein ACP70R_016324 [Stipagrostis hirtigluma subsp. patula]